MFDHHVDLPVDGSFDPHVLPSHGGVYLIADEQDRPILLASCESLRRVVVNRLASPPPDQKSKRANLGEIARRVSWRPTFSRFETAWAYWQAARTLNPAGYRKMIAFGPAWFLCVNLADRTPRFQAVREVASADVQGVGPFPTRRDAEEWQHMLEDAFDLCRYYHILEQTPHGQACAYFDMGKCPAPCNGSISLEVYRQMMADALAFSSGRREPRLTVLQDSMQAAVKSLAFEKAASIRQTFERASTLAEKPQYRHVCDLASCCWLIIQRGGPARRSEKTAMVQPFFVRRGVIEVGEPAAIADLDAVVPQWLAQCGACCVFPPRSTDEQVARWEALWLVSKFLFQAERAPGLLYRFDLLPERQTLVRAIRGRFSAEDEVEQSGVPEVD
jgi:excinuclease UvrABC nuclease subunit